MPAAAILQLPAEKPRYWREALFSVFSIASERSAAPLGLLSGVEQPAGAAGEGTQRGAGLGKPLVGAVAEPRCSRAVSGREVIRCGGLGCQGTASAEI